MQQAFCDRDAYLPSNPYVFKPFGHCDQTQRDTPEGLQESSESVWCGDPRAPWVKPVTAGAGLRPRGVPCRLGVVAVQEGGRYDEDGSQEKDTKGTKEK